MAEQVPGMAEAVAARMAELGLSPTGLERASGLSGPQAKQVRDGRRKGYQHKTREGIARALRWPSDWYDRIEAGEDPATFPDDEHPKADTDIGARLSAVEFDLAEVKAGVAEALRRLDRGAGTP